MTRKRVNKFQKMIAGLAGIPINLSGSNAQYYEHVKRTHSSGQGVDEGSALSVTATFACINLLASTVGSTPICIYRTEGKIDVVETGHPISSLLKDSPNAVHTPLEVWEYAEASLELFGNSYQERVQGVMGNTIALVPLRPDLMSVRRRADGRIEYSWTDPKTRRLRKETSDKILHIRSRMNGESSLVGASTLSQCYNTFATAQATDKAASTMFGNGVRPSGVLSTELPLNGKQRTELEELLQEKFQGAMNHNRPMVLDNKLQWQQLSMNASDSQMLESRRFTVEEICMIFNTPPHMIGYTAGNAVSRTLTEQTHGFQKFTLRPRYKRIEQALEKQLLTNKDKAQGLKIRFNLEALLRGVSRERSEFYAAGLKDGWLTINEVRSKERLPPVAGGDTPRTQMQNVPLTNAGSTPPIGEDDA